MNLPKLHSRQHLVEHCQLPVDVMRIGARLVAEAIPYAYQNPGNAVRGWGERKVLFEMESNLESRR